MNKRQTLLETRELSAGYGSHRGRPVTITGPLSLTIRAGQLICLLGPNGSGKSTLLRTLAGLQPSLGGSIDLGTDNSVANRHPENLAKMISLVLTDPVRYSNLTVYSLVALGRYPYTGWLGTLRDNDKKIIEWAMQVTGIAAYSGRKIGMLSDGENQKVMLARALAQDTPLMMLDEPTAHLDLPSRIQIMQLLHRMARETQKGILLSTHELDLALQVADEIWLLQTGGHLDKGVPEELVLNGTFGAVFDKEGIHFDKHTGSFHIHSGNKTKIRLAGNGITAFWTKRALQREGFEVTDTGTAITTISVEEGDSPTWALEGPSGRQIFTHLSALLEIINTFAPDLVDPPRGSLKGKSGEDPALSP